MQMCPECGNYYDESEYAKCPNCHPVSGNPNDDVIYGQNVNADADKDPLTGDAEQKRGHHGQNQLRRYLSVLGGSYRV